MKSNEQSPLYFSTSAKEDPAPVNKQPGQSPYLKAVLTSQIEHTGKVVRMAISDRLAAIRYIQESNWRNNFYRG